MPYLEVLEFEYPLWKPTANGERQLDKMERGQLQNPYANYLELLQHLLKLAQSEDPDFLQSFADCGELSMHQPGSVWSRYALLMFQWTQGPIKPGWYDFETADYTELLQAPLIQGCFDGQTFLNLDYYLTGMAELQAFKNPAVDSQSLREVWLEEGLIDFYWETWPLRRVLAEVCRLKGWKWFLAEQEPGLKYYRYALTALLSRQENEPDSQTQADIRAEIVRLHDHFVMQAADLHDSFQGQDLRQMMQDAIAKRAI